MSLTTSTEVFYGDGFRSRKKQDSVIVTVVDSNKVFVFDALPPAHSHGPQRDGPFPLHYKIRLPRFSIIGVVKVAKGFDDDIKSKDTSRISAALATHTSEADKNLSLLICIVDEESKKSHFMLPSGEVLSSKFLHGQDFISAVNSNLVTFRYHSTLSLVLEDQGSLAVKKDSFKTFFESGLYMASTLNGTSLITSFKTVADLRKGAHLAPYVSYSVPEAVEIEVFGELPSHPAAPRVGVIQGALHSLEIDVVLRFPNATSVSVALETLKKEISFQAMELIDLLVSSPTAKKAKSLHFEFPFSLDRCFNALFTFDPTQSSEDYNAQRRKKYCEEFGLALTAPLLHSSRALKFISAPGTENVRLKNVHYGLNGAGVGQVSICSGVYDYYHYMQDNFNDNGWGCAYRSLQTIQSWFINQNYSTKPVQNHTEIQKMLYLQGQREKGFVGSREWIGSIELQAVLREYMSVSSKILHIPSGKQVNEYVWDLIKHFESQGTPVMIGGGQLAYTLLGIDYNPETRKAMFLILDPHYTGKDELKSIQGKGWCGWKDETLFKENYFYNLMLPQLPSAGSSPY